MRLSRSSGNCTKDSISSLVWLLENWIPRLGVLLRYWITCFADSMRGAFGIVLLGNEVGDGRNVGSQGC